MGIDAGIVVVKQITDEQKWFQAMEHIQKTFMWEDYFEILPDFNKEDFNKVAMKKFNLDEDMNFSSNGFQAIDWHWREFPHKKDLSTLKLELSELKKKKEEFEKDERKYFGRNNQKDLENLTKAVEFKKNCDEESKELFQEISKHKIAHLGSDVVGYPKPKGKPRLFLYLNPNPNPTGLLGTFVPKTRKPEGKTRHF